MEAVMSAREKVGDGRGGTQGSKLSPPHPPEQDQEVTIPQATLKVTRGRKLEWSGEGGLEFQLVPLMTPGEGLAWPTYSIVDKALVWRLAETHWALFVFSFLLGCGAEHGFCV